MPTGKIIDSHNKGIKIEWEGKEYCADIENARKMGFKKNKLVEFEAGTDGKGRCIAKNVKISEKQPSIEQDSKHHSPPFESTNPKRKSHQPSKQPKTRRPDQSEAIMNDSPYHFVPIPVENDQVACVLEEPVFHDGDKKLLSGELRCTLTALTPLLVGNYSYKVSQLFPPSNNNDDEGKRDKIVTLPDEWNIPFPVSADKNILEPLRWIDGRVIIPGSSIKGMIRNNLAALLGAPMERVGEREYTYRPNIWFSKYDSKYKCLPAIIESINENTITVHVLERMTDVKYPKDQNELQQYSSDSQFQIHKYQTGIDGECLLGQEFLKKDTSESRRNIRKHDFVFIKNSAIEKAHSRILTISDSVKNFQKITLKSLMDSNKGHLTKDHQLYSKDLFKNVKQNLNKMLNQGYEVNQVIFVEIAEQKPFKSSKIVSFGHHLYYRWRYRDTVQNRHPGLKTRPMLRAHSDENKMNDDDSPKKLCGARLFFGYVSGKNVKGLEEIGKEPFQHLAGRIAINHALECPNGKTEEERFLNHNQQDIVSLKPLGMPRPSAVEFYLQQDTKKYKRDDAGILITYGDLLEGDDPGDLSGRKFYLHHPDAEADSTCYEDQQDDNVKSKQSTLARFVSKPKSEFKFTIRFRDLREWELGALLFVLEPEKWVDKLNEHLKWSEIKVLAKKVKDKDGDSPCFALKLGYGRPLGLGSIAINVKESMIFNSEHELIENQTPVDTYLKTFAGILKKNTSLQGILKQWLLIHQYRGRTHYTYPTKLNNRTQKDEIFGYHTDVRQKHAKGRRQHKETTSQPNQYTLQELTTEK